MMGIPALPATPVTKTFPYGAHSVTLETGAIARQASAAVIVRMDDTVVLVTAVAKKELATDPVFAPMGWLADVAYVDRANGVQAREALAPALEALGNGTSLVIAPEGTRSPTPKLLPFKKGAFHLALQAKVPIVPIVIRNAGEIMAPRGMLISSGTVDVAVLEPIVTTRWTTKTLTAKVAMVRQRYLDTLDDWPG